VKMRFAKIIAVIVVVMVLATAYAQSTISTTVVMRVSRMTQSAVVDAGEDLSMEVNIAGVTPASYQWYFNGTAIDGADQKVYNIVNAQVENAGTYRLDAFDAAGNMVVSMDIAARVIDDTVPQSGDSSMHAGVALIGMAVCAAAALILRRKVTA